jgi:UPF0755 protein
MKKVAIIVLLLIPILLVFYLIFWPVKSGGEELVFTVGVGKEESFWGVKLPEGGYIFYKNMSVWNKIQKIKKGPDLKWVKVLPGMRKEQIGEILGETFGWEDSEIKNWNEVYTRMKYEYREGVYFPDTYLIPVKERGLDIANRMINNFNEKFKEYYNEAAEKNIQWTTALKIASLIQREAGGKEDMGIISGVIWNRLDKNMNLQIDATVQYAKGKVGDSWWSHVDPADLKIDSIYNDYLNKGLPPTPICNPGLDAIEAALNPSETDCLYYLHDSNRQIHCAKTYEEHLENVEKYL